MKHEGGTPAKFLAFSEAVNFSMEAPRVGWGARPARAFPTQTLVGSLTSFYFRTLYPP